MRWAGFFVPGRKEAIFLTANLLSQGSQKVTFCTMKPYLSPCKTSPFGRQNVSFCHAKSYVLQTAISAHATPAHHHLATALASPRPFPPIRHPPIILKPAKQLRFLDAFLCHKRKNCDLCNTLNRRYTSNAIVFIQTIHHGRNSKKTN